MSTLTKNNGQTIIEDSNAAVTSNLQETIVYIRQSPNVALGIHQHLIEDPYLQHYNAPIDSSTSQTPKQNLDSSDNEDTQI